MAGRSGRGKGQGPLIVFGRHLDREPTPAAISADTASFCVMSSRSGVWWRRHCQRLEGDALVVPGAIHLGVQRGV